MTKSLARTQRDASNLEAPPTPTNPALSPQAIERDLRILLDPSGAGVGIEGPGGTAQARQSLLAALGNIVTAQTNPLTGVIEFSSVDSHTQVAAKMANTIALLGDSITHANYDIRTVVSAIRASDVLTIETSGTHGLYAGARAQVVNVGSDMDGEYTVLSVPTTTTYTVSNPGVDSTAALSGYPRSANMQRFMDNGWFVWGNILASQKFELVGINAATGRLTSEMLANVEELTALNPAYVAVFGGTNDVSTGVAVAATQSTLLQIYAKIINSGATVIAFTVPPLSGASLNATNAKATLELNNWIRDHAANNHNFVLVDAYAAIIDPMNATKGSAATGTLSDGIHPSALGAFKIGSAFHAALQYIAHGKDSRTMSNADNYGYNVANPNILDSAPWVNTGGSVSAPVTGSSASGWAGEGSGTLAAAASPQARSDGFGYNLQMVMTAAANNDRAHFRSVGAAFHSRMTQTDSYRLDASASVVGLAGSNYSKLYAYLVGTVDGASNTYLSATLYPSGTTLPTTDWSGVLRTPYSRVTGAITAGNVYLEQGFSAAGSQLTTTFGRVAIRKNF